MITLDDWKDPVKRFHIPLASYGTWSYLPTYLPVRSQHFVPKWQFSVEKCRIRGGVGGECPVYKVGILGIFVLDKPSSFQTLSSNAVPKRAQSVPFLALSATSKIGTVPFTPVAWRRFVKLAKAGSRRARRAKLGKAEGSAPHLLRPCLCSPALAKNAKKIIITPVPVTQAITLGRRLKAEFLKKNTRLAHKQEGNAISL